MGCKLVKKVLKICFEYGVGMFLNKICIWKDTFPCLFTWEWSKQILVWNWSDKSKLPIKLKVVLLKTNFDGSS
jgi:hypothetical protein